MRLGGTAVVGDCSFLSNSATTRGLAVAVVAPTTMSNLSFDRNDLYCGAGSYRQDTEVNGNGGHKSVNPPNSS